MGDVRKKNPVRAKIREWIGAMNLPKIRDRENWLEEQGGVAVEYDLTTADPEHRGQQFRDDGSDITDAVRVTSKQSKRKKK